MSKKSGPDLGASQYKRPKVGGRPGNLFSERGVGKVDFKRSPVGRNILRDAAGESRGERQRVRSAFRRGIWEAMDGGAYCGDDYDESDT